MTRRRPDPLALATVLLLLAEIAVLVALMIPLTGH